MKSAENIQISPIEDIIGDIVVKQEYLMSPGSTVINFLSPKGPKNDLIKLRKTMDFK